MVPSVEDLLTLLLSAPENQEKPFTMNRRDPEACSGRNDALYV